MPQRILPTDATVPEIHTSALLRKIVREAPKDHITLGWLVEHLPRGSFGVILLFLSMTSLLPVICIPAQLLMLFLIAQIALGYQAPVLPERWMKCRLSSRYLARLERHALPALERLEMIVRPRWIPFMMGIRRLAATIAWLNVFFALLNPLPFFNIPPAIVSILLALAYIERDGVLVALSLTGALTLLYATASVI